MGRGADAAAPQGRQIEAMPIAAPMHTRRRGPMCAL